MLLDFRLSMPGVSSWNGRWHGETKLYSVVQSIRDKAIGKRLIGTYQYSFGDGWIAQIDVKKVSKQEAAKLRRKTDGFCGYEWMVDSIIEHGCIKARTGSAE